MIEWIRGLQFMKSKFDLVTGCQEVEIEIFFYLMFLRFQHVLDFSFYCTIMKQICSKLCQLLVEHDTLATAE